MVESSFFHHLVDGPIVLDKRLIKQISEDREDFSRIFFLENKDDKLRLNIATVFRVLTARQ